MTITNTKVYGQLSVYMQVILWGGVILSFPNTLLQVWKFVEPGLKQKEKKYIGQITFFTIFSFLAGMAFAYFVMLPMVLDFAFGDILPGVKNLIEIQDYLSIFLEIVIISGLVFELPLIAYFLGRMGIITPPLLRHYRRHAIIGLLAIAAILSPGGNPVLQLVLFVPLWTLFELSILATSLAARRRKAAELAALT
jgi:sec-independent protein translocase protein TatC